MNTIGTIGLGIAIFGEGLRGIPNNGLIGSIFIIVGGIIVAVSPLVG